MSTDPGRVRHANQDACAAAPEHAAFVVCDGVGGAAGGEIASQLAAETFLSAVRQSAQKDRVAHSYAGESTRMSREAGPGHTHARLNQAVLAANAMVFERAQKSRALRGMATTLVAALLESPGDREDGTNNGQRTTNNGCPTLWLAHAGDSRAYRLRRAAEKTHSELTQLTTDHSLVEEQIRVGLLSRIDALRSPVRNVITRAIGAMPSVEPEIASHEIQPGDLYLLASDGLTRELADADIARILAATLGLDDPAASIPSSGALEAAAHALIDAANQHGGRDNITVLLLACQ
jgi:protein phosphatase